MAISGITEEKEIKLLLKKLIENPNEVLKFAIVARGPRDGDFILSKNQPLKKKEVESEAEAEAKKAAGGKAVKLDVMAGECRLHAAGTTTLRLVVQGKAVARAVSCAEHLLARGAYKSIGFTDVILEEVDELSDESVPAPASGTPAASATPAAPVAPVRTFPPAPPPPPAPPARSVPPAPPPPPAPDLATPFNERLKALLPAIKAVVGTPAGEEAKLRVSEAGTLARKLDFKQANLLLDQVEQLLKSTVPAAPMPDPAAAFNERFKALASTIKSAAGTPVGEDAKLRATQAATFARNRDFVQANQTLDQVESLLGPAAPVSEPGDDELEFRRLWQLAKAAWQTASEQVDGQISKLQAELKKSDQPDLLEIAEFGLNAITAGNKVKLLAAMRDVDQSSGESLVDAAIKAQDAVEDFLMHLEGDERVEACDANPFQIPVDIRATLSPALVQLDTALQSAGS